MTVPGMVALGAVAVAEREAARGVREEGGNNRGSAVERYLRSVGLGPGQPWCAAFVAYCLEAGAMDGIYQIPAHFPITGWCPALEAWARQRSLWIPAAGAEERSGQDAPQRGDLALFYFAAKGRVAHVGFVASGLVNSRFQSVEGNTGQDSPDGINREGDGVYAKSRSLASLGAQGGFARLPF